MNPIPTEITQSLNALNPLQLAWLSGYCWAKADGNAPVATLPEQATTAPAVAEAKRVTILSASQTGNARKVAETLLAKLTEQGVNATLTASADYKTKLLADEQIVLLVTSTQGEGEPPEEAVSLHKFLHGKKAPKLNGLQFAVLGLGDSSYPKFCGAAVEFDAKLADLGATRLLPRRDCDLDFQASADAWLAEIVPLVAQQASAGTTANRAPTVSGSLNAETSLFNKENPFSATLITRQKITGRGSDKDVRHIEFDLSGSGLHYQAGDALGVYFSNDVDLVNEILSAVSLSGDEQVNGQTIRQALIDDFEITQNTPHFVREYAKLANHDDLNAQIGEDINAFVANNPIVSIVQAFPVALTAEQLLSLLRPITPRLYSISSSPAEVGEEVHVTVGVLRYEHDGKTRSGGASSYLAERVAEDETVRVFVEHNPNFRLPENPDTPIIMIGAGTGVAPFRAFVQERAANEATGKNWLIFGNPHFTEDFLYQTEWQTFAKDGYLHNYTFAWSRDGAEKVYVQHKIRENATEIWQWLQQGAHIYVCGDASKMAKDVEHALLDVIAQQGGLNADDADEYLDNLRQEKRYQRDVY